MIDAFKKRRDFVLARLAAMPGVKINTPEGAFYAFPDIAELYGKSWSGGAINDSSDFAMYLLEEAHVAVVAGEAFGDPNGIRISYAASMEDLEKAMDRIENAIKALA
jgi:aspartate/methionine/tyrosine aminotransferase